MPRFPLQVSQTLYYKRNSSDGGRGAARQNEPGGAGQRKECRCPLQSWACAGRGGGKGHTYSSCQWRRQVRRWGRAWARSCRAGRVHRGASPRSRRASWMSLTKMVTRLAWMAHSWASSNSPTWGSVGKVGWRVAVGRDAQARSDAKSIGHTLQRLLLLPLLPLAIPTVAALPAALAAGAAAAGCRSPGRPRTPPAAPGTRPP